MDENNEDKEMDIEIPKYLTINDIKYSFKSALANDRFSYRCYHRKCKVLITIDKTNIIKILKNNNDNNLEIQYKTNDQKHICQDVIKTEKVNNIKTETESIELAKQFINQSLEKPLNWHLSNLKENGIILSKFQVKNILQKLREYKYPKDNEFLTDISKITISLSKSDKNLESLPFCFTDQKIINIYKNKVREERFIIFTTLFQLKKFKEINQVFLDGTYKYCPKNFYQLYNIIGKETDSDNKIPLLYVLMSHKSYTIYYHIFKYIVNTLNVLDINVNFDKISFMLDFEKSARNALINIFPKSDIKGCFFHFLKALWKKARKYGLCKKKLIKETILLIFALKIYIFIPKGEKENYFTKIEELYSTKDNYLPLLKYFRKNWINSKFLEFDYISRYTNLERANNTCEIFHRHLKELINAYHPKISFFVEKIKEHTILTFESSIKNLALISQKKEDNNSSYNIIFEFIKKIYKKYKIPLSYNLLTQLSKEESNEIINISIDIINDLFNFNNGMDIDIESINDENNEFEFDENMKEETDSNHDIKDNVKQDFFNENIFENIEWKKKYTKVKYDDNDFNDIYDLREEIEEELIEKKRKKKFAY